MTELSQRSQKKTPSRTAFCLMSLFLLALFLKNSELAAKAIASGLEVCAKTLLPSLFPFIVASELLVESGIIHRVGRLLHRPFYSLFGIGGDAACAVLLGFVCGFPVGTKCASSLCQNGTIGKKEFCRVLAFSNQPSSAFLIYTVGGAMFGSLRFGVALYLSTLLSALLIQLTLGLCQRKNSDRPNTQERPALPSEARSFPDALAKAVSQSALAMLSICAFVVFFSALGESLFYLADGLSLSPAASALLFGVFELTGGASHAALCSAAAAPVLCALAVGWGGLSIHFQLLHLVGSTPFSKRAYFLIKLAQGALNAILLVPIHRALG